MYIIHPSKSQIGLGVIKAIPKTIQGNVMIKNCAKVQHAFMMSKLTLYLVQATCKIYLTGSHIVHVVK